LSRVDVLAAEPAELAEPPGVAGTAVQPALELVADRAAVQPAFGLVADRAAVQPAFGLVADMDRESAAGSVSGVHM